MSLDLIGDPTYIALETFRKNGQGIVTPVWPVAENGKLYIITGGNSWKTKRMRNNPNVRVCVSDARGNAKGEWVEATASILDTPTEIDKQRQRLKTKYGWQYRLLTTFHKIMGRDTDYITVEIQ
ncbi:PPOX class F420-dependent oxidoreductase [Anaerolineales bacterium HSG24]|nr:PPOX class F420-dependent oxidoreductase [Anaerolineales bacterium HSG24]